MSEANMTREEALKRVDGYLTLALGAYLPIDNCEEVDEILKALNQSCDDKMKVLEKIKEEIKDWQTDIHDNEYDAESHDFVFERIYEIIDEYKDKENKE